MSNAYFSKLLPALGTRAARATVSRLGFSSPPLRQFLLDTFSSGYGQRGCFLGEPVFEATFGWRQAEPSFGALAGTLLHPALVDALDAPGGDNPGDYRFPRDGHPYTHQLAAWQALLAPQPQSVVVTSGTGSGKTECFMVPVLSRLAAEHADGAGAPVQGVRALFLYPLNALIQSQRERLRAWTAPFGEGLRFCLYNGNTPDQSKVEEQRKAPNEVLDRATLRRSPPPILVTNPTMLEYMLVRAQDAPILQQSQGLLEWIVLDEAHNYIGSQAAELALLLRRVLHAFGTSADKVRFVATSATIAGDDERARQDLQRFLADLAGVDPSRVTVVEGTRQVPALDAAVDDASAPLGPQDFAGALPADDASGRYQRLSAHPLARRLRGLFVPAAGGRGWQPLQAVKDALAQAGRPHDDADALAWLDLLTSAVEGRGRQAKPFLPLRLHAFHDTLDGLWVCADAACTLKADTALAHPDWPYGLVHMEERRHCGCGAPVYPLVSCNDCNETFLLADISTTEGGMRLVAPADEQGVDEFLLDREPEVRDADAEDNPVEDASRTMREPALLVGPGHGTATVLDRTALDLRFDLAAPPDADTLAVRLQQEQAGEEGERWSLRCPCCAGTEPPRAQFRRPRLGAPFLLGTVIPTLLEFCPDGDSPLERPMRGRRMITFTDSRQGTARIAARLQQDAERTALRAGVYLRLAQGTAGSAAERVALEERVRSLQGMLALAAGDPGMKASVEKMLQQETEKLEHLAGGKAVDWREMAQWLSAKHEDVRRWIGTYYGGLEPRFNGDDRGREELAEVLLCREFAHRPKRANSLETLGLVAVQYPRLQQVTVLPPAPQAEGLSLAEWRDFLKLCMDFFVRDRWCLQMPPGWERWGAQRTWIKNVLPPGSKEKATRWLVRWPQVTNRAVQPPLVRLLAQVLGLNARAMEGRDRIDALLRAAWDDLVRVGLLRSNGTARYLDPQDMALRHLAQGWVCPVTRRVLDTTLRGVTPYLPPQPQSDAQLRCRAVEMPVCSLVAAQDHDAASSRLAAVREWIEAQPAIAQARAEGLWSDISDRVLEGVGYFRAVEHSAQQSGELLKDYEREFREGRINLMSCSTTMEMGVDIGGINMVAMNNVPPHPANYLQRAGRAGRRAETRSVALTVCKNNPHDQHVFAHTDWPFTTPMRTPGISLSSAVLVRRHVNAMLLSRFLRLQGGDGRLDKLTMEWWMLPPEGTQDATRRERFTAWCEGFDPAQEADSVAGLRGLVRSTALEGAAPRALAREVGAHAARHARQWLGELQALDAQLAALSGKEEDRMPRRALEIQRKRLTGEYLLRELASSGFLPGYGFPTDITSFETLNKDSQEIKRQREAQAGREDNRFQRRELPSRDTVTALREYAPGASVVIDGLVYESAGITLNWHVPATAEAASELQNIRHAWRCRHCGANGTHVQRLAQCPECGHALGARKDVFRQYLEPAGFSVDLFKPTHNDITQQRYVAPEAPWISGSGEWLPLPNAALGRFRASAEGSVFHHSSGPGGYGYAVCLECGRAAPMGDPEAGDATPADFKKPHLRLRGRRGKDGDQVCGGSEQPFKIKQGLHFGREYTTDVLELTLHGLDGRPLVDPVVAYTLVVALRRAIARWLGIDEGELGCDTKELRDEAGQRGRTLQLFDLRAAGYSTLVAQRLPQLLREAREQLLCERACASACQHCLLGYDTRFHVDDLDRHQALAFLTPQWLDALALPSSLQLFGPATQAEVQPLDEALVRELNRAGARRLVLYLHGMAADWDLAASPLKALLHRLSVKALEGEAALCLVVPQADLSALDEAEAAVLRSLHQACAVELRAGAAPLLHHEGRVLASVERANGCWRSWATAQVELAQPDAAWGRPGTLPLLAAPSDGPELSGQPVRLPESTPTVPSGWTVEIGRGIDGPGSGFGTRFWATLGEGDIAAVLPANKRVAAVSYEDRYLHTPIACALLVEVVSALKAHYEPLDGWDAPTVCVKTLSLDGKVPRTGLRGSVWTAEWPSDALRDAALCEGFAHAGIEAQVHSAAKHGTRHARLLVVDFDDGTRLRVVPDQGVSYWTVDHARAARLPRGFLLDAPPAVLGTVLGEIEVDVRGHDAPMLVSVDRG